MNASYKIALVVAVGLLVLVVGFYATRTGDPTEIGARPGTEPALADHNTDTPDSPAQTPDTDSSGPVEQAGQPTPPTVSAEDTHAEGIRAEPSAQPGRTAVGIDASHTPDPQEPATRPGPEAVAVEATGAADSTSGEAIGPVVELGPPPSEPLVLTPDTRLVEAEPPAGRVADRGTTSRLPVSEPAEQPAPPAETAEPAPTREPVVPTVYVVQPGDMLVTIAERIYGSQAAWEAIAQANPSVDPTRLRVGQELRMPRRASVERPRAEPAPPTPGRHGEYTVKPGDNLYRIAEQFYDDAEKWDVIYNHNRDAIGPDPGRLKAGMTLVIPPAVNGAD